MNIWCNDGIAGFGKSQHTPQAGKHSLCIVRERGVISFYDNGLQVGSANFNKSLATPTGEAQAPSRWGLHIGEQNNGGGISNNGFTGDLYDVKMYARALTPEEVMQNHQFNNQHYSLGL
jgi:hypothetical protein